MFQRSFEEKLHSLVISELIKYHVKIIDDMCECNVMNPEKNHALNIVVFTTRVTN